jgi:hypothetical protein
MHACACMSIYIFCLLLVEHPQSTSAGNAVFAEDRGEFMYLWTGHGRPGADKLILDDMCHYVEKYCTRKVGVSHHWDLVG